MTAPTLVAVMQAIETTLDTITGLRASDVTPGQVNVSGNASVAIVGVPDVIKYYGTMGHGKYELDPTVTVLVSTSGTDRIGQQRLAGFASWSGTTSIPLAIAGDRTLGGIVDDAYVRDFRVLGLDEVGEIGYFGGVFTLQVVGKGV